MYKPGFSLNMEWGSNDAVPSVPKDWLHLRPPSPPQSSFVFVGGNNAYAASSSSFTHPNDFMDPETESELSASFNAHDCYPPESSPLMSGDWPIKLVKMPYSYYPLENPPLHIDCSYLATPPAAGQGFPSETSLPFPLDGNLGDIKKNHFSDENQMDFSDVSDWPEVTKTRNKLSIEGIFGLTLCSGNQCDNSNDNTCFGNQEPELSSAVCVQGNSSVSSMMAEVAEVSWQDNSSRTTGADNLYLGLTYPSCKNFSNNYQEIFEANSQVSCDQPQASIQFAVSSSEEIADDLLNLPSRGKSNFSNMSEAANDLCNCVEDGFSLTDDSYFPVGDTLTRDCLLPKRIVSSFPLYENIGTVSIPQVTEGMIGCKSTCLQRKSDCFRCKKYGPSSHDESLPSGSVDRWPHRIIDEKDCETSTLVVEHALYGGFGYSPKMCTPGQLGADCISAARKYMPTQSSAANCKHCSKNPESRKCGLDFPDCVIDCHTLVENIQNFSLLLIASHSSESDRLTEPDVQALISVIHNLSRYLTHRAGVCASSIQGVSQPEKADFGGSSSIGQKISKLVEGCYGENDAADYKTQVPMLSDICSASRGICIAEGSPHMTQIIAGSDQLQGIDSKMGKLSDLGKEKESERTCSEFQNPIEKLREDFEYELKERDTVVLLYKNLWSESQAKLSTMNSEMEHIKTEVEALKQKQINRAAGVFNVRGETPENRDRKTSLEVNSKPKENVVDMAAISRGKDHKDLHMITNLSSLMDVVPQVHAEGSFWERTAVLLSREESLRESETSEIRDRITGSRCFLEADLNPQGNVRDRAAILLSRGEDCGDPETKANLNSLMNVTPKIHSEGSSWESLRERKTSEIRDRITGSRCFLEADLNLQGNVRDRAAILLSRGKDCGDLETKANLNSLMNVTPEIHSEGSSWEQAGISFLQNRRCRESDINRKLNSCDHEIHELSPESDMVQREEILSRFNVIQKCNHSDMMSRNSANQFGEAIIDEPGSWNSVLHLEECAVDKSNPESYKSKKVHNQAIQGEETFWERASVLLSREEILSETSEIRDRTISSKCCVEVDLNPKGDGRDQDYGDPKTKTNLSRLKKVTHQVHDEGSIWNRAAILFSREENLVESDRSRKLITCDRDAMQREEILHRFKVLQECNHHSSMTERHSGKQFGEIVTDKPGSSNNSLHIEENACDESDSESYESSQEHNQAIQHGGLGNQSVYLDMDEVHTSLGVLDCREASGVEIKDDQTLVLSSNFERQSLCTLDSDDIHDVLNSVNGTEAVCSSDLGLKISREFGVKQFPPNVPVEENALTRNVNMHCQLESSSRVPATDVSFSSQSLYFEHEIQLENSQCDSVLLSDAFTTGRNCDNVFNMDYRSQILSSLSLSIPNLDTDKNNSFIGIWIKNCSNPSNGSADAQSLNEEELGCSSPCQHDFGQDHLSSKVESSSSESESSWEYVEKEEDIAFHV